VVLDARYIGVKFGLGSSEGDEDPVARFGVGLALEQAESGNVLIGSTREFTGFDVRIPWEAVAAIRMYTLHVAPAMSGVSIIRSFAGLRPHTPDGLPLLGPVDGVEGLVLAAGHEGDGITLAPITGQLIADYVCSGQVPPVMEACLPRRFAEQTPG
jgi:sarcosine oxidase subunit beta